jgi:hypothetical protein
MSLARSSFAAVALSVPIVAAAPAIGQTPNLWTVQAVKVGGEIVCDAFASGAVGRGPYEFRLRRGKDQMLFIVSYDGDKLPAAAKTATIVIRDQVMRLPATLTKLGERNAVLIALEPQSVDLRFFDQSGPFEVDAGAAVFHLALLESDHVRQHMEECARFAARQ